MDLSAVPGLSGGVLCVPISELGTEQHLRAKFRSAQAFVGWLGLCPDNRLSGGRILKAGTRKVANRIPTILRLAANPTTKPKPSTAPPPPPPAASKTSTTKPSP